MRAHQVEDPARRRRWIVAASAAVVLGSLLAAFLWWDTRGFDPGDTRRVTAEVRACGRLHVDVDGGSWASEEQHVRSGEGTAETGVLERRSTNDAIYTSAVDGLQVPMQRVREDYLWHAGCGLLPTARSGAHL